ncbi:MAG TPA: carboxymuconolactone decarboxylase family protein [Gammaproteobacteria bacterium]|nr:carboxymuconolactone decarboxylase family protein [Gammaproteobacteria bacterium]
MSRFEQIDPKTASGDAREAFDEAIAQFGGVINLFKVTGSAPNVLKGILALNKEVSSSGELDARLTEQVAMLTSALNRCDYCVNVHMKVGQGAGLSREDLLLAMQAKASDTRTQALLDFTNEVVRNRGSVTNRTLEAARSAGFSDRALLETIGVIGIYTTLQYIRHVADPEHDFPTVPEFNAEQHGADNGTFSVER